MTLIDIGPRWFAKLFFSCFALKSKLMRNLKWFKCRLGDFIVGKSIKLSVTDDLRRQLIVCVCVAQAYKYIQQTLSIRQLPEGGFRLTKLKIESQRKHDLRKLLGFHNPFAVCIVLSAKKPLNFMTLIGFDFSLCARRKFLLEISILCAPKASKYGSRTLK